MVFSSTSVAAKSYFNHAPLDHAVAGIMSGGLACLAVHPFDMVKVHMQVESKYKNTRDAFRQIVRKKGYRALFQGLSPNLAGNVSAWGIYFYGYNVIKDSIRSANGKDDLNSMELMLAANATSLGVMILTNPLWVIKTRMCMQVVEDKTSSRPIYKNMRNALMEITRKEGIRGLYAGFSMGVVNVTHGGFQFTSYEKLKTFILQRKSHDNNNLLGSDHPLHFSVKGDARHLSVIEFLSIVVVSKCIAGTLTYPTSVLRARLQDGDKNMKKTIIQCSRNIYQLHGILGFYRGLFVHLLRVTPHTCLLFGIYEISRTYLSEISNNNDNDDNIV